MANRLNKLLCFLSSLDCCLLVWYRENKRALADGLTVAKPPSATTSCSSRQGRCDFVRPPSLLKRDAAPDKRPRLTEHPVKHNASPVAKRLPASASARREVKGTANRPKSALPKSQDTAVKGRTGPYRSVQTATVSKTTTQLNTRFPKRDVPSKGLALVGAPSAGAGLGSSAVRHVNSTASPSAVQRSRGTPGATIRRLNEQGRMPSHLSVQGPRGLPNAVAASDKRLAKGTNGRRPANSLREMELRREFLRRREQFLGETSSEYELESDEEAGSEFDDFIDDSGYVDEKASSEIRRLFKYNPKKYRNIDLMDDSDMEASYGDICREEAKSTRIGLLEDLAEFKREQEKKQKSHPRRL
uniref:Uncharacterized protein n=1 Tax=Trichuris muris TaxID=70415 RepID=A0A5S6QXQ5_TRIMR